MDFCDRIRMNSRNAVWGTAPLHDRAEEVEGCLGSSALTYGALKAEHRGHSNMLEQEEFGPKCSEAFLSGSGHSSEFRPFSWESGKTMKLWIWSFRVLAANPMAQVPSPLIVDVPQPPFPRSSFPPATCKGGRMQKWPRSWPGVLTTGGGILMCIDWSSLRLHALVSFPEVVAMILWF